MLQRPFCINSSILKAVHAQKNLNVLGERMDEREENNILPQLRSEGIISLNHMEKMNVYMYICRVFLYQEMSQYFHHLYNIKPDHVKKFTIVRQKVAFKYRCLLYTG